MKLTKAQRLSALEDIDRNDGVMWQPRDGYEAEQLWADLKANGLVERNLWTGRYRVSSAGRAALEGK